MRLTQILAIPILLSSSSCMDSAETRKQLPANCDYEDNYMDLGFGHCTYRHVFVLPPEEEVKYIMKHYYEDKKKQEENEKNEDKKKR